MLFVEVNRSKRAAGRKLKQAGVVVIGHFIVQTRFKGIVRSVPWYPFDSHPTILKALPMVEPASTGGFTAPGARVPAGDSATDVQTNPAETVWSFWTGPALPHLIILNLMHTMLSTSYTKS